jgi:hypothetical protein
VLGPASSSPQRIEELFRAGVDVFRLNFSHGTHESHGQTFRAVRAATARARRHVAILQDLSGPKIRTGRLRGGQPIDLHKGDELRIAAGDEEGGPGRVFTPYAELIESARPGDRLLLDDGKIELRVREGMEPVKVQLAEGGLVQAAVKKANGEGVHARTSLVRTAESKPEQLDWRNDTGTFAGWIPKQTTVRLTKPLPPGRWTMRFEADYCKSKDIHVDIERGQTTTVEVSLEPSEPR